MFIGRSKELQKFNEFLEREKGILLVSGESGVGKTGLMAEFYRRLKDQNGVFTGLYECQFTDESKDPYLAVLGNLVGDAQSKLEQSALENSFSRIGQGFKGVIDKRGDLGKAVVKDFWQVLKAKVGMGDNTLNFFGKVWSETKDATLGISLLGEELKKYQQPFIQTYLDIFQALKEEFSDKRFVLMLDQFERADMFTHNLLQDFAPRIGENVFLILSFKVEEYTKPGEEVSFLRKYESLKPGLMGVDADIAELSGLSWEEIGEWIEKKWHRSLVKPQLVQIEKASGGLPLVLEEWLESPALDINDLGKTPQKLNEYFKRRINALESDTRDFAYRLSVLLNSLSLGDYVKLLKLGGKEIADWQCQGMLEELEQHLLFKRDGAPWFRHEKVKGFTEKYMGEELKKKYHHAAVEFFLEKVKDYPEKRNVPLPIGLFKSLAFHYYGAWMWEEAYKSNESLAKFAFDTGSLDVSVECCLRAVEAAGRLGDEEGKMVNQGNLANVYLVWGQMEEAYDLLLNVLRYARHKGHRKHQAVALHQLGIIKQAQGDYKGAERLYQDSLKIEEELEDKGGIGKSLHQLSRIKQDQGDYKGAERLYQDSLKIAEEVGDKGSIAKSLHQLGIIKQAQGDYKGAERLYQDSLKIAEELGDKRGIALSLGQLGIIKQDQGDYKGAEKLYQDSLKVFEELGDKSSIATALHQLGIIKQDQGDYKGAERLYQDSLKIKKELGDKSGIATSLGQLGKIQEKRGKYQEALEKYQTARDIFHKLKSPYKKQAQEDIERVKARLGEK